LRAAREPATVGPFSRPARATRHTDRGSPRIAIMGGVGSGKTRTAARMLGAILPASRGDRATPPQDVAVRRGVRAVPARLHGVGPALTRTRVPGLGAEPEYAPAFHGLRERSSNRVPDRRAPPPAANHTSQWSTNRTRRSSAVTCAAVGVCRIAWARRCQCCYAPPAPCRHGEDRKLVERHRLVPGWSRED
jgi:hypothetical protein